MKKEGRLSFPPYGRVARLAALSGTDDSLKLDSAHTWRMLR